MPEGSAIVETDLLATSTTLFVNNNTLSVYQLKVLLSFNAVKSNIHCSVYNRIREN